MSILNKLNRNRLIIIIVFILITYLSYFGINEVRNFFQVDDCLDKGGQWNYESNICDCEPKTNTIEKNNIFKSVNLKKPTIVIIQLDSLEIEKIKSKDGEDNFYAAMDDLMWYDNQLTERADSLNIPILHFKDRILKINTPSSTYKISKDTLKSINSYLYYDGEDVKAIDLIELIEVLKKQTTPNRGLAQ